MKSMEDTFADDVDVEMHTDVDIVKAKPVGFKLEFMQCVSWLYGRLLQEQQPWTLWTQEAAASDGKFVEPTTVPKHAMAEREKRKALGLWKTTEMVEVGKEEKVEHEHGED